jgi:hypothetical protein
VPSDLDVQAVVQAAKKRGYFDSSLIRGSYTPDQLRTLFHELDRRKIPRETPEERMDRGTALKIINALRTGTVPQCDLSALTVGRTALRARLTTDLHDVAEGSTRVRYLDADYGVGKTHSLWLLADMAFRENFAVSFVTLSPTSCPMHSLLAVYGAIVDGVQTSTASDGRGLEHLFDRWIEIVQRDGRSLAEQRLRQLAPYVVTTLAEYAGATHNPVRQHQERQMLLLNYLAGKRCPRRELRNLGITHLIDDTTALPTLEQITVLVRHLGFRGLCIFLDEAESVLSLSRGNLTNQAYMNLYHIAKVGPYLQNCFFIYAATPSFFNDYASYWPDQAVIDASTVYNLEPLQPEEHIELAERICGIYGKAYDWLAPVDQIRQIVPRITENGGVGALVRILVAILDRLRSGG